MNIRVAAKLALALRTAVALGLVACGSAAAGAEGAPIYKCVQASGAVLYADYPCNGGAILDIHPGVADPAANERLQRAQAELDKGAARRRADEELAAQRAAMERLVPPPVPEPDASYPDAAYGYVFGGYPRSPHRRPPPPRPPKRLDHRHLESGTSMGALHDRGRNVANGAPPRGGG